MTDGGSADGIGSDGAGDWVEETREIADSAVGGPTDDATCSYSESLDEGDWHCHRAAAPDADRCRFHLPAGETDDDALADAFLDAIRDSGARAKQFVGAEFGTLDLDHEAFETPDNHPIDLREATVRGDLNCEYATVDAPLFAQGLTVEGTASFDRTTFGDVVSLAGASLPDVSFENCEFTSQMSVYGATVRGSLDFEGADFGADVQITDARVTGSLRCLGVRVEGDLLLDELTVEGDTGLRNAVLDRSVVASDAEFAGDVTLLSTRVGSHLLLPSVAVGGDLTVTGTTVEGKGFLSDTTVGGTADLSGSEFGTNVAVVKTSVEGDLSFQRCRFTDSFRLSSGQVDGTATFDDTQFEDSATFDRMHFSAASFDDCTFRRRAQFEDATFAGPASFVDARFERRLDLTDAAFAVAPTFERADIEDGRFVRTTVEDGGVVTLRDVTLRSGEITLPTDVTIGYDCTRATVGDVQLGVAGYADLLGGTTDPLFDHFRFHDTTFDGFDFGQSKDALAAADWRLHDTADELEFGTREGWERKMLGWFGTLDLETGARNRLSLLYVLLLGRLKYGVSFGRATTLLERMTGTATGADDAVDDPTSEWQSHGDLENTYLKAKNGADQVGDRTSAAEFFMQEMAYRRKKNRDLALGVGATGSAGVRDRLAAAGSALGNYLLHATCGYGERLWRVVYMSSLTVLLWTLLYTLFTEGTTASTSGLTTRGIGDLSVLATPAGLDVLSTNLYFSVVTFTTLGYGDIQPVGTTARFLAGLESFVGALLVALVVFVLGRRVAW